MCICTGVYFSMSSFHMLSISQHYSSIHPFLMQKKLLEIQCPILNRHSLSVTIFKTFDKEIVSYSASHVMNAECQMQQKKRKKRESARTLYI